MSPVAGGQASAESADTGAWPPSTKGSSLISPAAKTASTIAILSRKLAVTVVSDASFHASGTRSLRSRARAILTIWRRTSPRFPGLARPKA